MKKFFCLLLLLVFGNSIATAQLVEIPKAYKDIYELKVSGMFNDTYHVGVIRQTNEGIYLCKSTDNQYEDNYASILLGPTLTNAVLTLEDLIKLPVSSTYVRTFGMNGAVTSIVKYSFMGQKIIKFKTDGIAGETEIGEKWLMTIKKDLSDMIPGVSGTKQSTSSAEPDDMTPSKNSFSFDRLPSDAQSLIVQKRTLKQDLRTAKKSQNIALVDSLKAEVERIDTFIALSQLLSDEDGGEYYYDINSSIIDIIKKEMKREERDNELIETAFSVLWEKQKINTLSKSQEENVKQLYQAYVSGL